MKVIYNLSIILLSLTVSIFPQKINGDDYNTAGISVMPYFQTWKGINNTTLEQYSSRIFLSYFINRDTRISLQSGYASSEALQNSISGLSDAQLSVNYRLRKLNTAFDFGVNLPTGEEKVDLLNFQSSVILCQEVFSMKMPLLRQGTNIFAGATWAKDLNDNIIVGVGASYQIKGKYNPISGDTISYKPSNELLFTCGVDFRINSTATVSGDVIGIIYGDDKINGINSFSAGTKTIFNLMFRKYFGYNNLMIFVRYRNCASEKLTGISADISSEKISPDNLAALINFAHRITGNLLLNYLIEGRFYEKTVAPFSGYNIYGIGITSDLKVSPNFSLPFTAKYYVGNSAGSPSISGLETGLGLNITF